MKLKGWELLVGWLAVVYIANVVSVQYGGYPFLYCWGRAWAVPLYEPWGAFANLAALCYFGFATWRRGAAGALAGLVVCLLVWGLPSTLEALTRLGGSCGGK